MCLRWLFPAAVQVCVHRSICFCVLEFMSDEASYHRNDSSLPQNSCWSWGMKSVSAKSVGGGVTAKWHRHNGAMHGRIGDQVIHTSSNTANGDAMRLWARCHTLLYIVINTEVNQAGKHKHCCTEKQEVDSEITGIDVRRGFVLVVDYSCTGGLGTKRFVPFVKFSKCSAAEQSSMETLT